MNTISNLIPIASSATGQVGAVDKGKSDKGGAKNDNKAALQQQKAKFLDQYMAAILDGDFKTATKLRVELAKLGGVSLPNGQKAKYTEQLEKLRNEKGELYNQLIASVADGKNAPPGINSKLAKVDILGNIIQEALGMPKKNLELPPAAKIQFQTDLEKLSKEKGNLYDKLLAAGAEGKDPPAGVKQKLATINMLGEIMNEALGNSKKGVPLPRTTTLQYQGTLDKLPKQKGEVYDKILASIIDDKDSSSARSELAKIDRIGAILQESLGRPKTKIPINEERAEFYQSQYVQAAKEHARLQDQLLAATIKGDDPPPGLRAGMAKLSLVMGLFNEAVSNNSK